MTKIVESGDGVSKWLFAELKNHVPVRFGWPPRALTDAHAALIVSSSDDAHIVARPAAEVGPPIGRIQAQVFKASGSVQDSVFLSSHTLGSQSSILLPSGSMIHANLPFS